MREEGCRVLFRILVFRVFLCFRLSAVCLFGFSFVSRVYPIGSVRILLSFFLPLNTVTIQRVSFGCRERGRRAGEVRKRDDASRTRSKDLSKK